MAHLEASDRLVAWLKKAELSEFAFSKALGVSHTTVRLWRLKRSRPNLFLRRLIERQTEGAVKEDEWLTTTERQRLRRAS